MAEKTQLERLARVEERLEAIDARLSRLERSMYGDGNPDNILARIERIEATQKLLVRLLTTNLGLALSTIILYIIRVVMG